MVRGIRWKVASLMGRTDRQRVDRGLGPVWVPVGVCESDRSGYPRLTGTCTHASVISLSHAGGCGQASFAS